MTTWKLPAWLGRRSRGPLPMVAVVLDHNELLALVARADEGRMELLQTICVEVADDGVLQEACGRLASQLAQANPGRYDLLVGVPRSQVEMRTLQLPAVGDAELPMLVRNELLRQIPDLPEDAPIDFLPAANESTTGGEEADVPAVQAASPSREDGLMRIEAAALRPESSAWIRVLAQALDVQPARILLRNQSLMELFFHQVATLPRRSLLLNLVGTSADLSVLSGRRVVFSRTVHASTNAEGGVELTHLADEIRRTLFVAPRDADETEGGSELEHIYMFADLDRSSHFVERLADELQGSVSLLDPLADVRVAFGEQPEKTHRLAVLLGMVWEHLSGRVELDFANPTQPPAPVRRGRRMAVQAAAASLALAVGAGTLYSDITTVRVEADDLANRIATNRKMLKRLEQKTVTLNAVRQWEQDQVHWLDELERISRQLPESTEAVVQRMNMTAGGASGVVGMSLKVKEPSVLAKMEELLRDSRHQISSQRISQGEGDEDYPCQFEASMLVKPAAPAANAPKTKPTDAAPPK